MSVITRAIQPPRLCRTCLIRQSVQSSTSLRELHTSRPNRKQFNQYQARKPSGSGSKGYPYRPNSRPAPVITVEDFKSKAPPRPNAIAKLLARRIDEWAKSVRTSQRLEAYRIPPSHSRGLLKEWADVTGSALDKIKTDEEAVKGMEALGVDEERLTLAIADETFSDILEATYLRSFLDYTARSSGINSSTQRHIKSILEATDLSRLPNQFNYIPARALTRHFHLHIGPTNSGKTYNALKALAQAKTGAYAGPLRLLAHEVWERMNLGTVGGMVEGEGRACNLLTGEERRIVAPDAGLIACTVEMLPSSMASGPFDVVVIDEIQMLGDPQRGGSWTNAVLGVQAKDIHLCGDETTVKLLHQILEPMGDKITVHNYDRLTPLLVADASLDGDYNNVQPGDCIVTFSRSNIFAVKKQIEGTAGKKCAVVYGALPPETRADQARDFNDENGRSEVLVASDAVGMGLNL
jgi:ATP-dependent RNA helicase SUPV3L1/SUV3